MASKKSDSSIMPFLVIGGAIAALVYLSNRNRAVAPGLAPGAMPAMAPVGATGATGGTGNTAFEPALEAIGLSPSVAAAGASALTAALGTGGTTGGT